MDRPKRKHPRLKNHHYGAGTYFVTVCTQDRRHILSDICAGRGFGPAVVRLTPCGEIAEKQLLDLERRYPAVHIDKYVIMPDHIHAIVRLDEGTGDVGRGLAPAVNPHPTLADVMCTYKSLTTRFCRKLVPIPKLFQTSFHDHVIRNETDYMEVWAYIDGNPARWAEQAAGASPRPTENGG